MIVFGFPQDKISAALKLFTSIGETQEPQPGPEGANWFKISYKHEWEAARAVRKNGELMNGQWMVGVKWAVSGSDRPAKHVSYFAVSTARRKRWMGDSISVWSTSNNPKSRRRGYVANCYTTKSHRTTYLTRAELQCIQDTSRECIRGCRSRRLGFCAHGSSHSWKAVEGPFWSCWMVTGLS